VPRTDIGLAQSVLHGPRHGLQDAIAGGVPIRVVEVLEVSMSIMSPLSGAWWRRLRSISSPARFMK